MNSTVQLRDRRQTRWVCKVYFLFLKTKLNKKFKLTVPGPRVLLELLLLQVLIHNQSKSHPRLGACLHSAVFHPLHCHFSGCFQTFLSNQFFKKARVILIKLGEQINFVCFIIFGGLCMCFRDFKVTSFVFEAYFASLLR